VLTLTGLAWFFSSKTWRPSLSVVLVKRTASRTYRSSQALMNAVFVASRIHSYLCSSAFAWIFLLPSDNRLRLVLFFGFLFIFHASKQICILMIKPLRKPKI
jgi:hypothetical protein